MTNSETINTSTLAIKRRSAGYSGCPNCGKALSIAEVIERHCENCARQTSPKDMIADPGAFPITNPDSLTPP
ncbi:hypothetical protein [Rhizobium leguminosarum]|uniref:hypothetical protein n=1 Tax=Rhizobium leguminosarum TaxID=384 RepID=UPI001AE7375B|nr:hypothetical protein [Rhizobium leguminosarum]